EPLLTYVVNRPFEGRGATQRHAIIVMQKSVDDHIRYEPSVVNRDDLVDAAAAQALLEISGIQVLRFDRTIPIGGTQEVDAGRTRARQYLNESGAHVLVWGTLLAANERVVPKLYFTLASDVQLPKESARYQLTNDLDLPPMFRSDL